MKLAYKLYYLSRLLLADTKLTGVRLTYEARFMKVKKFKNAIKRAIGLGYLGK